MPAKPHKRVCGVTKKELDLGREALDYLISRTKEDPFFLVTTCVHAGHIPYTYNQQFAEIMMEMPDELRRKLTDEKFAYEFLSKQWVDGYRGASHAKQVAPIVAKAARCYYATCFGDSKKEGCKTERDLWELVACLDDIKGIGNKMLNLFLEYIGDSDAVAIDRHIGDFMCNDLEVYCPPKGVFKKGKSIPDKMYRDMIEIFRTTSEECGLEPAHLQVSAWAKKACEARMKATKMPRKRVLYLGRGKVLDCNVYNPKQRTLKEWKEEHWE